MSQGNVEIVRRGIEAVFRRPKPDWATVNDLFHPGHEFISYLDALEGGKHVGAQGYRDWLLSTEDAVEWTQRLEQVKEIDRERVLAIAPTRVRAKSSGIALQEQRLGWIMTVRGGKIVRTEAYGSPEEALKAVEVEG
jgi:ketosteroid isomerase-like protein